MKHGHTGARGAHAEVGTDDRAIDQAPQNLSGLSLHLVFFVADEGNDVVNEVARRRSGASGARDRLERGHHDRPQPEGLMQRGKGHDQPRDRAVGIGDDTTATTPPTGTLRIK